MSQLSTHVLDTASGKPASSLSMRLIREDIDGNRVLVKEDITNDNGRTELPLLTGGDMQVGFYELVFEVAPYLEKNHKITKSKLFFDVITIRFRIIDSKEKYHVPLLLSPWSYSTYRGS